MAITHKIWIKILRMHQLGSGFHPESNYNCYIRRWGESLSKCTSRPRGKESTEVQKSQIKGKESENSYQELKRSQKGQACVFVCACPFCDLFNSW